LLNVKVLLRGLVRFVELAELAASGAVLSPPSCEVRLGFVDRPRVGRFEAVSPQRERFEVVSFPDWDASTLFVRTKSALISSLSVRICAR
jgi:hypothetical protein